MRIDRGQENNLRHFGYPLERNAGYKQSKIKHLHDYDVEIYVSISPLRKLFVTAAGA